MFSVCNTPTMVILWLLVHIKSFKAKLCVKSFPACSHKAFQTNPDAITYNSNDMDTGQISKKACF